MVELATNCYGCHVLQKALDCEEDIRLLIVSELLLGDPALTLVNKHASHVWSKVYPRPYRFTLRCDECHLDHGIELDTSSATDIRLVSNFRLRSFRTSSVSPPSVNKSLKGKWASLACHETGSLVVQVTLIIDVVA